MSLTAWGSGAQNLKVEQELCGYFEFDLRGAVRQEFQL